VNDIAINDSAIEDEHKENRFIIKTALQGDE